MLKAIGGILVTAGIIGGGVTAWRLWDDSRESEALRERMAEMRVEYETLREHYNEAVRRTAVTELLVENGELSVRVVNAEGVERIIDTPFDPTGEVYVDYVVLNGRLWIRRVFDAYTPPAEGMIIDPAMASVDWRPEADMRVGKAVYRSLSDGRWVVTVTGDGSLGLARCTGDRLYDLSAPPKVGRYEEVKAPLMDAP
ncbi:MAG: hypothetical protein VYC34_05695 [Planctomycetota bacterium]|nr:hypothetical protein [Planctomycetota bacterium]